MTEIGKCPRCGSIGSIIGGRCCWNCIDDWHREQAENMLERFREFVAEPDHAGHKKELEFAIIALEHLVGERPYMVYPDELEYQAIKNGGERKDG